MSVDTMDVEQSLLKKNDVKAAYSAKVYRFWMAAARASPAFLRHLRLLFHHLLTIAGTAIIVTFSLTPATGLYQAYREAHWRAAEDARNAQKLRVERSYQIMEWSYVCTALDVEGQAFTYNIACHSYAMKSNSSFYKDVVCTRSTGTNAEGILMLQQGDNCTRSNATVRSGCRYCPSPRGFEYPWELAVYYVGANLLCVYHCITAIYKFWHYRTPHLHEYGQSTNALRAGILSRAWHVYFSIACTSISVNIILLFVVMDMFGRYYPPNMFCTMSLAWICASNYAITDETRFVCTLPDTVFAGGTRR